MKALQEEHTEELQVHADQVRKEFSETEEDENLLEACWASRLAKHKKSEAYQKEVALAAGPFLHFAFEACRQQFLAQGYPPTGEDTSFLDFEAVLHSAPDPFARPITAVEYPSRESEGDLDCLLGEAVAKVRDAPGQMKSGSVAEKSSKEEPPQPLLEDVAGPSKESLAQVEEKTPSVG
ncbi:UNVERIFIED_CONTAM: hypothetical protein Sradi_0682000 [Sesamum radiatum]|uniref:Uncharacterized protein n=1 Tax=Sesamum radiatum TaxID=300843 RepID=A0AAW2VR62_SESRA